MFSAIPYQEQIEVKRSNLCWLSILFDFLTFRSLIFYIILYIFIYIYILLIYYIYTIYGYKHKSWNFMNSNCCLQKHWWKKPWKHFQFFVITSLWCKIFEIFLKCSFYQVFRHIPWKSFLSPLHILVKNSSSSKLKFLFFSFYFFIFYIFEKLLTSASFLFQINFSIFPFLVILAFQKYIIM